MCLTNTLRVRWVYSVIKLHSALWGSETREVYVVDDNTSKQRSQAKGNCRDVRTHVRTSAPVDESAKL